MARLVEHTASEPIEIKPQKRSVWVCACGLSRNFPLCDGSHRRTKDEPAGELARYDADGRRVEQDNA